jgi:uncharacterized protein YndB with AHSA1/START domain
MVAGSIELESVHIDTSAREIVATRVFDAPRALVYQAWVDPKHLEKWWGPIGFTTTVHEMDVRAGGIWRLTMLGPDGTTYPNRSVFKEVVAGEKIVYAHSGARRGGPAAQFEATITFADEGPGRTRVTLRSVFPSLEVLREVEESYGAAEGAKQTLSRLANEADSMLSQVEVVSRRVFEVPRSRVFDAFRNPEQLAQWWGPKGFTNTFSQFDFRPGGAWRFVMHGPDGTGYHNASDFVEIVEPERIVFVHQLPMHRFTMTMTFDDAAGASVVTWRMRFESVAEAERVRHFIEAANEENLDRLASHLSATA